ncbi:MAG: SAVED domain-containing protein [Candidatus Hodarchaeota archaeon]
MNSKTTIKLSDDLLSLSTNFKSHKNSFKRAFYMILDRKTPIQLKQYPEELFISFKKIKTPGVAINHYIDLILLLFLARTDFTDLSKNEINLICSTAGIELSIDVWKKLTGRLNYDSNDLLYKIKRGKDRRLLFSSNKDLIRIMEKLISNSQAREPHHDYSLAIFSKSSPKDKNNVDYLLDFSKYFKEKVPSEDQWLKMEDKVTTVIETIYENNPNAKLLLKDSKLHSSLAFILGHSVNYFESLDLLIYHKNQYWHDEQIRDVFDKISEHWILATKNKNPINDDEINVIISVNEPIKRYVEKYLKKDNHKNIFSIHFSIKPEPHLNSVDNQNDAHKKINAIYAYLTKLKTKIPYFKIHLFVSAPISFIILLGIRLSSVALIQLYEFYPNIGYYIPNVLLQRY